MAANAPRSGPALLVCIGRHSESRPPPVQDHHLKEALKLEPESLEVRLTATQVTEQGKDRAADRSAFLDCRRQRRAGSASGQVGRRLAQGGIAPV